MKCEECVKAGEKSRVNSHGGMSTLMGYTPYYDEDGVYHNHDGNRKTNHYSCSNGHQWVEVGKNACPAKGCDFGGDFEIKWYPAKDFYDENGKLKVTSVHLPLVVDSTDK